MVRHEEHVLMKCSKVPYVEIDLKKWRFLTIQPYIIKGWEVLRAPTIT